MKTHTVEFKENIKNFGRELKSIITYTLNDEEIVLSNNQLNAVSPHYEGAILKSIMKQIDVDSNVEIPEGTVFNYRLGIKVREPEGNDDGYDYINYGNYIVYSIEKQENTNSYKIVAYDKMLYSMKEYEQMTISYPTTIRNYINVICTHLGLTFKNANNTFVNYDKQIERELYIDEDGNVLNYTFRDVLDELAQVTASTICINEEDDELEIRYVSDAINETTEIVGNNITINNAESNRILKLELQGNTSQETTTGKQLVNFNDLTPIGNQVSYTWQNDTLTVFNTSGAYRFVYVDLIDFFNNNQGKILRLDYDSIDFSQSNAPIVNLEIVNNGTTSYPALIGTTGNISIYAIPSDTSGITRARLRFMSNNSGTSQAGAIVINKPILHFNNVQTAYEPYTGGQPAPSPSYPFSVKSVTGNNSLVITNSDNTETQTYPLSLGNIELNSTPDGTVRDYIYGTPDNWYKREYIGKVVLDGSESWGKSAKRFVSGVVSSLIKPTTSNSETAQIFSNKFIGVSINQTTQSSPVNGIAIAGSGNLVVYYDALKDYTYQEFATWLSSNNVLVYYVKSQYTDIPITDTTLISQLNNMYENATLYDGITNIITNGDGTPKVKIEYITNYDTIDENYLKDVNVNFGEKFGPINTIVFSRSAGSDKIALSKPENLQDEYKNAIEIADNQILNFNNRDLFLQEILNKLYGFEYYINDFSSTGICYYNLCDRYNIQVGENVYDCIMLNDEVNVTQGLQENIYTDLLEGSDTDYSKTDKTDRVINQTTLIVDKQGREIEALVNDMYSENGVVNENYTRITQNINEINTSIQTAGGTNLLLNSVMFAHDDDGVQSWNVTGIGTIDFSDSSASVLAGGVSGHVFILNDMKATQRVRVKIDSDDIPENEKTYYTFSTKIKKDTNGTCYVKIFNSNEEYIINVGQGETPYFADYEVKALLPKDNYYDVEFYGSAGSNATFTDNMFTIGNYKKQWTQANGEILNTQVNLGINGVSVKSATSEGTETNITPFEFAGYTMINGVRTKVFTLNGDTTDVEKIKSKKEINMPPLKIVPITTGTRQGWAFVPTGGDN